MNIAQLITLKIGGKPIFQENLSSLKAIGSSKLSRGSIKSPNNFSLTEKRDDFTNYDVFPKFIATQNMQKINQKQTEKILSKKVTFNNLYKSYFSEKDTSFTNSLNDLEEQINGQEMAFEYAKNRDHETFMDMLSLINSGKTNESIKSMLDMSMDNYLKISPEDKKCIYSSIYNNRPLFNDKLQLFDYYNNVASKVKRNPPINKKIHNEVNGFVTSMITKEQIILFKKFIGDPLISDQHVMTYFDPINPKVLVAGEKYFRNIYKNDFLTLYYYYPDKPNGHVPKVHKFSFTSEVKELFIKAQDDYMSIDIPRLFLENGKEIVEDRKIKCIGALNIANNSKIKVLKK